MHCGLLNRCTSNLAEPSLDPEQTALTSEVGHLLEEALLALPDQFRAVVMLRDVEELNTEETPRLSRFQRTTSRFACIAAEQWCEAGSFSALEPKRRTHFPSWVLAATGLFTMFSPACFNFPQVFPCETVSLRAKETGVSAGVRFGVLLQDAGPWPSTGHPMKRAPGTFPSRDPRQATL